MTSEFDKLEEYVMADMRGTYTETVIDHAMNPRNAGSMEDADAFTSITGPCGDTMVMWLKVTDNRIEKANFWTDGCGTSIAAGTITTEKVKGKTFAEVMKMTPQGVLDALGGLPEESVHCALLAANTLKEAIKDYLAYEKEPWKKAYRQQKRA